MHIVSLNSDDTMKGEILHVRTDNFSLSQGHNPFIHSQNNATTYADQ